MATGGTIHLVRVVTAFPPEIMSVTNLLAVARTAAFAALHFRETPPKRFLLVSPTISELFDTMAMGAFGRPFFACAKAWILIVSRFMNLDLSPELVAMGHALMHLHLESGRAESKPVLVLAIKQETLLC